MEFLEKIFYSYFFVLPIFIFGIALVVALVGAIWGGRKLFSALSPKSRLAAWVVSFVWYVFLFFYFLFIFIPIENNLLLAAGVAPEILWLILVGFGRTFLILSVPVLLCGGVGLFFFIKKRREKVAEPVPVFPKTAESAGFFSWVRALWLGTRRALLFVFLAPFVVWILSDLGQPDRSPEEKETAYDQAKTEEQVAKIRATKLTLDDVMGVNLPPPPDPTLVDATVAGVDANKNGIRDDVELAIFEKYPDSARIRAALLQYALALQKEFTQELINPETVTTVAEEGGRANICITEIVPRGDVENSIEIANKYIDFVESRQLNTDARREAKKNFYKENLRSYGTPRDRPFCDVDLSSLPN